MNILTRIARPWDHHSGVHSCATCNGLGVVASHTRATTWNPYPEVACPDCDGQHVEAACDVCGSTIEAKGYDCLICAIANDLPANALGRGDEVANAIKAAMDARLTAEQVRA